MRAIPSVRGRQGITIAYRPAVSAEILMVEPDGLALTMELPLIKPASRCAIRVGVSPARKMV